MIIRKLTVGETYEHLKNHNKYTIINFVKLQVKDRWLDGVLYNKVDDNVLFVISQKEFIKKFQDI